MVVQRIGVDVKIIELMERASEPDKVSCLCANEFEFFILLIVLYSPNTCRDQELAPYFN